MKNVKGGIKFDEGKPMWNLVPLEAVQEVAKVLTMGANKYGKRNWVKLPDFEDRYMSATLRHITQHQSGELFDEESGLLHISHATCNLIFLAYKIMEELKCNAQSSTSKKITCHCATSQQRVSESPSASTSNRKRNDGKSQKQSNKR